MSDVPSARLILLKDFYNYDVGDSVRITGMWKNYDKKENKGIVEYEEVEVEVDTIQVEQNIPKIGELVQCLGEIKLSNQNKIVSARIIRVVNTLDMTVYEKTVSILNKKYY